MSTLLTMHFDSEDEEDEEYVESLRTAEGDEAVEDAAEGTSASSTSAIQKPFHKSSLKVTKNLQKQRAQRHREQLMDKTDSVFREMQMESRNIEKHTPTVDKNDFMLQFHKRYPKPAKKRNSSLSELQHFLDISVSTVKEDGSNQFSLKDFKCKCRQIPSEAIANSVKQAIGEETGAEVVIKRHYLFAGKVHTIEKTVNKDSRQYQRYLQEQETKKESGGTLAALDDYLTRLNLPSTISAVDKSAADWKAYTKEAGIEGELGKGHGFLEKQAFLLQADWQQHDRILGQKNL